jgi:hypothetical protein
VSPKQLPWDWLLAENHLTLQPGSSDFQLDSVEPARQVAGKTAECYSPAGGKFDSKGRSTGTVEQTVLRAAINDRDKVIFAFRPN